MPDYQIQVGEGDFGTRASSFIFEKNNDRTITMLYMHHGLISHGYDEARESLTTCPWQEAVRGNPGCTVWLKQDGSLVTTS